MLIAGWVVTAALASPVFGIYHELRAAFCLLPPLALVYVYCQAHRRRATALLALIATLGVGLAIGLAALIPKATTALLS